MIPLKQETNRCEQHKEVSLHWLEHLRAQTPTVPEPLHILVVTFVLLREKQSTVGLWGEDFLTKGWMHALCFVVHKRVGSVLQNKMSQNSPECRKQMKWDRHEASQRSEISICMRRAAPGNNGRLVLHCSLFVSVLWKKLKSETRFIPCFVA